MLARTPKPSIRDVVPERLTTVDECLEALTLLESIAADIEEQIAPYEGLAAEERDTEWAFRARRALRATKSKIRQVLERRGQLGREERRKAAARTQENSGAGRFLRAAREALTDEEWARVVARMQEEQPGAWVPRKRLEPGALCAARDRAAAGGEAG